METILHRTCLNFTPKKHPLQTEKKHAKIKPKEHQGLSSHDWDIIFAKTLMWVGLAFLGFLCTITGTFYAWIFVAYFAVAVLLVLWFVLKKKLLSSISPELWIVSIVILAATVLFSLHVAPTIFSGRDQGTMSEAAIRLAQNHKIEFFTPASDTFFKIYGSGKALNFPGFYYTASGQLTPQFPLVYISWLAIFYSFFGLTGLIIANAILLLFFLFSFYALARNYLGKTYSALALVFVLTSFSFMWFAKFTLSENMALALLWIMILALVRFIENRQTLTYLVFMASGILLVFTRIEGIAFFAIACIVLLSHAHARQYVMKKYKLTLVLPLAIAAILFLASLTKQLPYYKEVIKGLLNFSAGSGDMASPPDALPVFYAAQLFTIYGMLGFIILGFVGAADAFIKKRFKMLAAFFIVVPSLIYLVDSHISSDHPWMLRRYVFSVLPAGILYTSILLASWHTYLKTQESKFKFALPLIVALLLISFNLPSFLKYVAFSENSTLLKQTETLSSNFSARDLVLVDRLATSDGWAMLTGPLSFLYGKDTAYFFNPNDLARIDTAQFDPIYLITPDIHRALYTSGSIGSRLTPLKNYSISTTALDPAPPKNTLFVTLPNIQTTATTGTIYSVNK